MEGKDLISNVFLVHESTPKKMPEVRTLPCANSKTIQVKTSEIVKTSVSKSENEAAHRIGCRRRRNAFVPGKTNHSKHLEILLFAGCKDLYPSRNCM